MVSDELSDSFLHGALGLFHASFCLVLVHLCLQFSADHVPEPTRAV
jgi:hypothetical protein